MSSIVSMRVAQSRPQMWMPACPCPSTSLILVVPPARDVGATIYRKENRTSKTLSCNECRRLKLKCDRIFPCQSCCKRGCAEICPDGALTSGKGSRFILANTEQLHDKIQQLSDRVRQLEEALEILQKQYSTLRHPLLTPDLLKIKSTFHVGHKDSQAINHVPNNGMNGADNGSKPSPTFYRSPESPDDRASRPASRSSSACPEVPPDLLELSSAFPVPWTIDLKLRKRIRESLPPFQTAQALCRATRENALWQFNLDASNTFLDNLLAHVYSTPIEDLSPRRLSLLLMNLAVGSVVSESESIGSHMGEAFHHLARASACEIPLTEAPDFDVVHTLFYMIWYQLSFSNNSNAVTLAWNTMGLTAKLAQGLGLRT
ncbi:hypothetical protein ONZ45_g7194 [Pleurotus djamor]|nr:hypothetical protein ONZ45_g7194 [Pleurotus djamor]